MISTIAKIGIVTILFVVLTTTILSLLAVNFQTGIFAAIDSATPYMSALDVYLPVDTLLAIVGLVVAFEGMLIVFKLAKWALS
jgi:hypothetical protein